MQLGTTDWVSNLAARNAARKNQRQATLLRDCENIIILRDDGDEALAEGHTVAEKMGLEVEDMHRFIEVMFSWPYAEYTERMLTGNDYQGAYVNSLADVGS